MKKNRITKILILLSIITCSNIHAQYNRFSGSVNDTNFYQIINSYLQNYHGSGEDTSEASEFTQFKRWQSFWGPRLGSAGSFKIAEEATENYLNNSSPANRTSALVTSDWECLGPFGGISSNGFTATNNSVGRIEAIAFDPNYNGTTNQIMYAGSINSGLWKLDLNVSNQWSSLNTDQQLARLGVSSIAVDPILNANSINDIFVASSGTSGSDGVYRSEDNGVTWTPINSGLFNSISGGHNSIGKILIDPTNANIIYAATSIGLFKCSNRQASNPTWAISYGGSSGSEYMYDVLFDPTDNTKQTLYACGIDIIKTIDGGANWTHISNGNGLDLTGTPTPPAAPFNQSGHVDYIRNINIAISADGAFLYSALITASNPPPYSWLTSQSNYLFQLNTSSGQWTQKSSYYSQISQYGGPSQDRMAYQVSPTNNQFLYTGSVTLVKSSNGGANWSSVSGSCEHADHHAIEFAPNNSNTIFVGTDGGIWKLSLNTSGNATSCTAVNNGLGVSTIYFSASSAIDPYQILAGMQDDGQNYLKNNNWENVLGGDGFENAMDYKNVSVMYANSNGGLYKSTGSATSPSFVSGVSSNAPGAYGGAPIVLDPINPSIIYEGRGDIWKSTSGSLTINSSWTKISDLANQVQSVQATYKIAIAPSDPKTIYVDFAYDSNNPNSLNGKLAKTTIGGGTGSTDWVNISPTSSNPSGNPLGHPITGMAVSATDPNHIWITYSGYDASFIDKVQESKDGGITWTAMPWVTSTGTSLPNLPVNCIVYEKGSNDGIYIGTDVGVYYHNNAINGWEPFMTDLPNVIVDFLEINYTINRIRAATYGRGVWESPLACPLNNDVTENNVYSANTFVEAYHNIYSTAVDNTNTVTYRAGNQIDLQVGFHATAASLSYFHGFIHDCDQPGNSFRHANTNQQNNVDSEEEEDNPVNPNKVKQKESIDIIPNPNNGNFSLNIYGNETPLNYSVNIIDVSGRLVKEIKNIKETSIQIDLLSFESGIYFVKVILQNKQLYKKVIIQN